VCCLHVHMYACIYECLFLYVYHIIITTSHELGPHRPVSASSNSLLKGLKVFVHSVCNSALYLAFCCRSFLLHVVANFVCIFLVSCQLFLLSTLPTFLYSCCGQTVKYSAVLQEKFISIDVNRFSSFSDVQNFASL
jgi:hypothetical protein